MSILFQEVFMKARYFFKLLDLRSNALFFVYLTAIAFLLYAVQEFAYAKWGIVLFEEMIGWAWPAFGYLYELAGWTLLGFLPMAGTLCWFTILKVTGGFYQRHQSYCSWINELAVALGLLGTIRGFIVVASGSGMAADGASETLSAILVGMGSTFLGITVAIWALLLQSPKD
jgi:hypothetical protein